MFSMESAGFKAQQHYGKNEGCNEQLVNWYYDMECHPGVVQLLVSKDSK